MTIKELKSFIFENEKIEFVLESIGCHHIKYHPRKDFYSCGNYNGDNTGAVNVKNNEYLNVTNWTRTQEFSDNSDIIDLVQYNKKCSFVKAVKYLHKLLDIEYNPHKKQKKKREEKFDPLEIFKRIKTTKKRVDVADIHVLDEEVLDEYVPLLHIDFYRDGIMPWTRDRFGLAYSYKHKRVVIPHRHWLTGKLLGMNMRTTVENYSGLGIKKYYLTEGYNKSNNLYGLYENYDSIQEAGYVVLVESEKSVLKRDSLNDGTLVALAGKTLSLEQTRILIGLDVEIIIALDNDVNIDEIRYMCESFYRIRNVSYVKDRHDLLDSKDSPADASNKVYNFLIKFRTKYTDEEHKKYLKSLEK